MCKDRPYGMQSFCSMFEILTMCKSWHRCFYGVAHPHLFHERAALRELTYPCRKLESVEGLLSRHPLVGAADLEERLAAWNRKQVVPGCHEFLCVMMYRYQKMMH